ncbi:MAG TPA: dUTP diphosphatase [Methylomirabilota bacterium]
MSGAVAPRRCSRGPGIVLHVALARLPNTDDLPLPAYQTAHAAAMDLHAAVESPVAIAPGGIALVGCGFAIAVPEGFEGQVRPRSGLAAKHGLTVVNAPGTIDSDYRGEVKVALINLGSREFTVERGMRIAQLVVAPVSRVTWDVVDQLEETARGAGGFGHTGTGGAPPR